jgi:DNA-binding phage protein
MMSKSAMPLTIEFKEVLKACIDRDPAFGHELLASAVQAFLDNDLATGRAILRNYVNATIGFQQLARIVGGQEKSLMRMLSANGSPLASNLFEVINALQQFNDVHLEVRAVAHKTMGRAKTRS